MTGKDTEYMQMALDEAKQALDMGEIPVGAVIVWEDRDGTERIVSKAHNLRETDKNALGHAECLAIERACRELGGWRLHRATLYVTMEPCPMCAGAVVNARIKRVCCSVADWKAGAFGSVMNLNAYPLNHKTKVEFGLCDEQSRELLQTFFTRLRDERKQKKQK